MRRYKKCTKSTVLKKVFAESSSPSDKENVEFKRKRKYTRRKPMVEPKRKYTRRKDRAAAASSQPPAAQEALEKQVSRSESPRVDGQLADDCAALTRMGFSLELVSETVELTPVEDRSTSPRLDSLLLPLKKRKIVYKEQEGAEPHDKNRLCSIVEKLSKRLSEVPVV